MDKKLLLVDKEISRLLEKKNRYPLDGLYHYTKLAGLEGILSTRRLWLTRYDYLDDKLEIKHAHTEAIKLIQNYAPKSQHKDFWNSYVEKFNNVFEVGDYFIGSFSSVPNNEKLWKDYAKSGGVAIKFRKSYFHPIGNMNKKKKRYNYATIQQIDYQVDEFKERLEHLIICIDGLLEDKNDGLDLELKSRLTTYLLTDMPTLKVKEFSEEQECRLYQFGFKPEINAKGEKYERIFAIPQVKRNDKTVLLRRFKQKDICEIILNNSADEAWLKKLLHKMQFTGVKIRYRSS
jgi:hypothetical protein